VAKALTNKDKEKTAMQTQTATDAGTNPVVEEKIKKLLELYADAPEVGRSALEKGLANIREELGAITASARQTAGRVGARQGKVSELTAILNITQDGAKRLRGLLEITEGNFKAADIVGTLHDMRFVFLDNDTKLLFATAYDGEWDAYIDDFVTKIPTSMDMFFCNLEGWPGIHDPNIKDWLVAHQITADAWYVANPDLTVAETKRLARVGKALEEFLDKVE
jgi:hypothetical protein